MSAYFITATGTEIGKTFATCALIHAARARALPICAYKPVISGFDERRPAPSDTADIIAALGLSIEGTQTLDRISPLRLKAPLSPNMAARREGKTIDFSSLVDWTQLEIQLGKKRHALTLIEGIGGAMVPLDDAHTVRDWISTLNIPVILVTGSYLGSISHTLSTLEALRAARIDTAALIVSESAHSTVTLAETLDTIGSFAHDIPRRIAQPRVASPAQATAIHGLLEHLS